MPRGAHCWRSKCWGKRRLRGYVEGVVVHGKEQLLSLPVAWLLVLLLHQDSAMPLLMLP